MVVSWWIVALLPSDRECGNRREALHTLVTHFGAFPQDSLQNFMGTKLEKIMSNEGKLPNVYTHAHTYVGRTNQLPRLPPSMRSL